MQAQVEHIVAAIFAAAGGAVASTVAGAFLVVVRVTCSGRRRRQLRILTETTPDKTGRFRLIVHRMMTETPDADWQLSSNTTSVETSDLGQMSINVLPSAARDPQGRQKSERADTRSSL